MSKSTITKNALAQSLKCLMLKKAIRKISVQKLTDTCGVTRHTFYNHFHDIYELLGWIFEHEVIDELDECDGLSSWKEGLFRVVQYTLDNKVVCINTCKSLGREHLEMFLFKTFKKELECVIADITVALNVDKAIKEDVAGFFSYAITGQFLEWINMGLKESKESVIKRIERILDGTIVGIMEANSK